MTDRGSGVPSGPHRRPGADPVGMTEAEKRAAEWEARHDVAARGGRGAPDAVQHYFAHERLSQERATGTTRPRGADEFGEAVGGAAAPAPQAPVQHEAPALSAVPPGRRGIGRWFRRLGGRGD